MRRSRAGPRRRAPSRGSSSGRSPSLPQPGRTAVRRAMDEGPHQLMLSAGPVSGVTGAHALPTRTHDSPLTPSARRVPWRADSAFRRRLSPAASRGSAGAGTWTRAGRGPHQLDRPRGRCRRVRRSGHAWWGSAARGREPTRRWRRHRSRPRSGTLLMPWPRPERGRAPWPGPGWRYCSPAGWSTRCRDLTRPHRHQSPPHRSRRGTAAHRDLVLRRVRHQRRVRRRVILMTHGLAVMLAERPD